MKIVKVVRKGQKNSRVQLEDGTILLVSNEELSSGEKDPSSIQRKVDSAKELNNINICIKRYLAKTGAALPKAYTVEDLAQEIFLSFWEKDYWGRYDSSKNPNWLSFIYTGVGNFIKTFTNSAPIRELYKTRSLHAKVNEEGSELMELLADEKFSTDEVEEKLDFQIFRKYLEGLGHTGLTISYQGIFDELCSGKSQADIAKSEGYSETTIAARRKQIAVAYREFLN